MHGDQEEHELLFDLLEEMFCFMHTLERKYRLVSAHQNLSFMVAVEQQQNCCTTKGLLSFLGCATKGRLMMDASSAIAIATRSGVGSVRHLAARYLWVQREVENQSFSVEKVAGQRNPADLGTKHVDVKVLEFCRDFVGLKAAHLDDHEEQETKNTVNNISHRTDAFASEQETQHFETVDDCEHTRNSKGTRDARTLGITDESYVRLEVQISLSSGMMIAFFVGPVILGATLLMGGGGYMGWMVEGLSILRSCVSFHRARRTRRSMSDD